MSEQKKFPPRVGVERQHVCALTGLSRWKAVHGPRAHYIIDPVVNDEYLSLAEHQHLMAENERRIERLREALEFYSRNGGASDTHDRKGCWILARRFCFVEAIAHDCEKLPYGETGTEYYMAGKLARAALQEDWKCNKQKEKTK